MNKVEVIPKLPCISAPKNLGQSALVHRQTIANNATALMLATDDPGDRRGILLLAIALGCEVTK